MSGCEEKRKQIGKDKKTKKKTTNEYLINKWTRTDGVEVNTEQNDSFFNDTIQEFISSDFSEEERHLFINLQE